MFGAELRRGATAPGTGLAQVIDSLADALGRVLPNAQQRQLGVQLDPVELMLQVVAWQAESQSSTIEWRVLSPGDERHASVAHSLKIRLYSKAGNRDPENDPAEQSLEDLAELAKVTIYISRNRVEEDDESPTPEARLLVRREVVAVHDEADLSQMESIRVEHHGADASCTR
jgi:hypothetical protein